MLEEGKGVGDRDLPGAQVSMWAGNGHEGIVNDGQRKMASFLEGAK